MQVSVIRHTKVNVPSSVCCGQTDVELADAFHQEVVQIHTKIENDFEIIFSSPLSRCKRLAETFSNEIIFDDRLKEFNFGDWEMKSWNEIPSEEIEPWYADFVETKTPNGESMQEMSERLFHFMDELRNVQHEKVLIVTHGGIIRLMWCYVLQIPIKNAFKIPVNYGEIFQFNLGKMNEEDFILRKE
ncbi:alpha-ribazole phosphatase [Empedobacter tilapiae]|uniref:Alpha-ribazole phosphatase n=1 Tax=Empedobacter tilapiae TaxID=2491114 RepID=A0A4Z1BYG1_9FLAO|nr:alpha-ribazole phosphatase [Empedobacter tilapiae]TGN30162.1 alpha-ribazole phosphatase [Empedobacter tilapiae]